MPTRAVKRSTPITRGKKVSVAPVQVHTICHSCHALPAGSIELTALMLVLVFSLSAVLFTSVYALQIEKSKRAQLEAQVTQVVVD